MTSPTWIPDHSAIAAFRENPEMFRLKYRLHLQPATPDDKMRAGSAIHAGRNVLWSGGGVEDAVRTARAVRGEVPGARDVEHVERLVRAYAARYPREAAPFKVIQSEEYVEALITTCCHSDSQSCDCATTDFAYCGILDGVIRFADGAEYVCDLKSTGAYLNVTWMEAMKLSDQMTGYVAIRRALGFRCDGYYVDGVHVRDPKPRKDGTFGTPNIDLEGDFYRFGPEPVGVWRVERWVRDMRYTLAQIAALEAERGLDNPWPIYQNWPYGKVDAYREFYEAPAELHAQVAQMFERREWSPRDVAKERAVK